jgi:hypothetical protein
MIRRQMQGDRNMRQRFQTPLQLLVATAFCVISAAFVRASDDLPWPTDPSVEFLSSEQLSQNGFVPLFDGTSLDVWNVQPGHEEHWVIRDGVIDYDGMAEQRMNLQKCLWTKKSFGEVELYAEWRFPATPTLKPQPIVLFNGDFLLDEAGKRVTR